MPAVDAPPCRRHWLIASRISGVETAVMFQDGRDDQVQTRREVLVGHRVDEAGDAAR